MGRGILEVLELRYLTVNGKFRINQIENEKYMKALAWPSEGDR